MSDFDRNKWNNRYRQQEASLLAPPSSLLERASEHWQPGGRALDVAGGTGRQALALAERGLRVTLADISAVALERARSFAAERELPLETLETDLELDPFPAGPWDVIVQVCFLNRQIFPDFIRTLAPGGLLVVSQPTVRNLERHEKPPRPFLLEEGELHALVAGLDVLHYEEGWLDEGRYEAHFIGQKRGDVSAS